ncbi:armadillo-like helical domain-containing protein 3 [Acropora muricata]|uniref:armadillo-like helical domain-containing protein 3 n=1 Tax=Acropora millepora TaxID=45264 RepID=UPI0010FC8932|nr:armadillo-like helical domain-containing protein 3 [Acropora millepora]
MVHSMADTKSGPLSPKKPVKEKIVGIYDDFFKGEDPSRLSPNFWHEFFLMRVNAVYLEKCIDKLGEEELMDVKENINLLFSQCCIALRGDHQIKLVNSLQTLCALVRAVYRKRLGDHGFDVINILIGFDAAEAQMQGLLESLHTFLVGDYPVSLKNLSLKLALILVTATDNVSQNTIVEYIMINSIFEAVIQVLADPVARQQHGYEAMLLLTILVNYRKYEASNPYIVKLSILDDELALNGFGCVISAALTDYNRKHAATLEQATGGLISSITSFVGSMFVAETEKPVCFSTNEAVLLALYEAVHLNRNFFTVLSHVTTAPGSSPPPSPTAAPPVVERTASAAVVEDIPADLSQPTNLLVTLLTYSSIALQNTKDDKGISNAKLCQIILTCIVEDQYANAFLHDANMTFSVPLHKAQMYHRGAVIEKHSPSRPLACALLDLMVEFIVTHMMKTLPSDLYSKTFGILHRMLCYQKRCRVRLAYSWKNFWTALMNFLKFLLSSETHLAKTCNIFSLASQVVNIFNLFITYGDTFLPSPTSYDELYYEIIRVHQIFDNLYSMALRHSTNGGDWKEAASRLASSLVNVRAIVNHFTPKIDSWAALNHLTSLSSEQVLTVIRSNYDTLTLKLQENLDHYEKYSEKPKEASFFTQLVRSIVMDVRRTIHVSNLEQFSLLQEFASIH